MADTNLTKIELYEYTLSNADTSNIDENAQYNIKDMPIGGITNAQMLLALQPNKQGVFKVGSVYMCIDTVQNQYTAKHFYKFTGYAWQDVSIKLASKDEAGTVYMWEDENGIHLWSIDPLEVHYTREVNSAGGYTYNITTLNFTTSTSQGGIVYSIGE